MNIIPCLTWVRRGVAKAIPDRVKLDEDELKRIIEDTKDQIDEVNDENDEEGSNEMSENEGAKGGSPQTAKKRRADDESDDVVHRYGLDDYDDDEDTNLMKGIGNLTYYASNADDPYVTMKEEADSDDEDLEIKATDNLIVAGRAEKDVCSLEVYVYNEDLGNLFIHHDILLSSFPLAIEWLNYDIGEDKPGNFVAVGTMEPVIEIWDLDVVDSLEPVAVLGTKAKSKKKKKKTACVGHTDSVLDLSWNRNVRNVLASASADMTIGLWDMSEGKIVTSIQQHKDKVQCVSWHPTEQESLISGSFDHTVKVYDCRNPNDNYKSWNLQGEVEHVMWDKDNKLCFFATTDKGCVYYLDSRQDKPIFTLSAHNEAVTGLCQSCKVPGLIVTTSTDQHLKIWDILDKKPSLVLERNLKMKELFCVEACPEAPFVFAVGGEKEIKVWDIRESATVRKHFASRAPSGVTMEGSDDVTEIDTEAMNNLTIDKEELEDIQTFLGEDTGDTKPKKKKKKRKKKPKPQPDS